MTAARRTALVWLLLAAFTVVTRLPALLYPKGIDDEAVYGVVAREMVEGGRPYADAVERKPPLLFWTYAAIFRGFGSYNWCAVHGIAVLWTLLTMAGLFLAARARFGWRAGAAAAFLYSLYLPWLTWKNLAFNGEMLMNLPVAWAMWLALRRRGWPLGFEAAAVGVLCGLAVLLKQPAGIAALAFGLYLLLPGYRAARSLGFAGSLARGTWLTLGFVAVLGAAAVVLQRQGILADALYWIALHPDLTDGVLKWTFWQRALMTIPFVLVCAPLIVGAVLTARDGLSRGGPLAAERDAVVGLVLLTGCGMIGVAAGARFYPHYYLQLLPALSVLAAPAVSALVDGARGPQPWPLRPRPLAGWLGLTAVAFTELHAVQLAARRAPSEAATWVREHTSASDRIFIWGQGAAHYAEADRRPATRYIATFPLTGYVFGHPRSWDPAFDTSDRIVPGAWDHLAADLSAHPPVLILDTDAARETPRYPMRDYPFLRGLLDSGYVEVARTREAVIYGRNPAGATPR